MDYTLNSRMFTNVNRFDVFYNKEKPLKADYANIVTSIITHGDNVHSYNVEGIVVHELNIKGDVVANGDSIAVTNTNGWQTPLINISAISKQGMAVQISKGKIGDSTGLIAKGAKGNIVED